MQDKYPLKWPPGRAQEMHLGVLLLLQNMSGSGGDNDDTSVYEMMCSAGEWATDGKWREGRRQASNGIVLCPPAYDYAVFPFILFPLNDGDIV